MLQFPQQDGGANLLPDPATKYQYTVLLSDDEANGYTDNI